MQRRQRSDGCARRGDRNRRQHPRLSALAYEQEELIGLAFGDDDNALRSGSGRRAIQWPLFRDGRRAACTRACRNGPNRVGCNARRQTTPYAGRGLDGGNE